MTTPSKVRNDTEEPDIYVLRRPGSLIPTFAQIDAYEAVASGRRVRQPDHLTLRDVQTTLKRRAI